MLPRWQVFEWVSGLVGPTIEHMGTNHGRRNIGMAEQLLDRANVLAPFQQVSGEAVA